MLYWKWLYLDMYCLCYKHSSLSASKLHFTFKKVFYWKFKLETLTGQKWKIVFKNIIFKPKIFTEYFLHNLFWMTKMGYSASFFLALFALKHVCPSTPAPVNNVTYQESGPGKVWSFWKNVSTKSTFLLHCTLVTLYWAPPVFPQQKLPYL